LRHASRAASVVFGVALAWGCVPPPPLPEPSEPPPTAVLVISIDGLRPDAVTAFRLPTLGRLMAEGSYARVARTVLPSTTLPSHTSMLTGVTPDVHGITWNTHRPQRGVVPVPTVFELARAHGHRVGAFYAKSKFRHLDRPGSYDLRLAPAWNLERWMATDLVPEAAAFMLEQRPALVFFHIGEPDYAGHIAGWMGWTYRRAARRADSAVARLLAAADAAYGVGGYHVLVTSDHGGHGRAHGRDHALDVLIPWIVRGPRAAEGAIDTPVRTVDTAATVLWLLGIPLPAHMEGRPVREAFRELSGG
jgi:predicted AlkP superfamily pyrophosphatase or phosphodiesterase